MVGCRDYRFVLCRFVRFGMGFGKVGSKGCREVGTLSPESIQRVRGGWHRRGIFVIDRFVVSDRFSFRFVDD
jgi:hypothetical protein